VCSSDLKVLDAGISGDVVEFGCYKGATSLFLARILKEYGTKRLYLYDSFEGLPPKVSQDNSRAGDEFQAGELATTKRELVRTFAKNNLLNINGGPIIVKSWFKNIRDDQLPECINFAFFDGDFYESIRDSFDKTGKKFAAGATIIIDDYVNEHLPGAAAAADEWLMKNRVRVKHFRIEQSLAIIVLH
jgi:O-methyltransferase